MKIRNCLYRAFIDFRVQSMDNVFGVLYSIEFNPGHYDTGPSEKFP